MKTGKQQHHSNENFDRVQNIALQIADENRVKGREYPKYGYSLSDFEDAERIVYSPTREV
jgi:hypothetical protein